MGLGPKLRKKRKEEWKQNEQLLAAAAQSRTEQNRRGWKQKN